MAVTQWNWADDWAEDIEIARIDGPNGSASVLEVFETDHDDSLVVVLVPQADGSYRRTKLVYSVDFDGQRESFTSLGEAYLVAGRKAGHEPD